MADQDLLRIRETAAAYAEAVRATQRFFDRVEDLEDPSVQVEYATLAEAEKRAAGDRLDALTAVGVEVPSIDDSDAVG
ncbi:hypothetical protein COUCH_13665 [Couchioplanes caeruleus]|uniref:hypothetical protein n=1 Tax=Couchioplanes caeruleus TaxID=56438 RepID=UPI0020C107A2|nr:hypothetical protein [Couchioplanes caeruleus]UQU67246.1 hypothetical protein COUCH_13665 [Couchioplanes caeruleus]